MLRPVRAALLVLCCAVPSYADNWPAWRGADGSGHSPEKNLPVTWTADNVRWKTALPERGNSTPVVWGDRIFLTQATDKSTKRAVLCLARADGKLLWKQETPYTEKEPTHATNPYCSGSPVTDGERVIACLGSAGMVCYDMDGKEQWRKDLGKLLHIWGNSPSPVLHGDLCITWAGPGNVQKLLAVDKKTGKTVWEHDEPGGKSDGSRPYIGSWSTPLIVRVGDHDELFLGVPEKLKAFDPKTGKELWTCDGLHNGGKDQLVYTSPVYADGIVVAMAGFGGASLAAKNGGKGDVTATNRLWYHAQAGQRIGSPVIVGDNVYIIDESGTAHCLELKTGTDLWKGQRMPGTTWSSPVVAEGRLYLPTKEGNVVVLATGPKFEVLAKNSLDGEMILSSPAISKGDIFIRTHKNLWCIGATGR
jgi:outer membrane protein assembly factor BamB